MADQVATPQPTAPQAAVCTICLDPVVAARSGLRSVALLKCGHEFHLDCIGSAFNAKGKMECPNCRNIEQGNWQIASTPEPSSSGDGLDWEVYQYLWDIWQQYHEESTGNGVTLELPSDVQSAVNGSTLLDTMLQNHDVEPISSVMERDPAADLNNFHVFGTDPRISEVEQFQLDIVNVINSSTTPLHSEIPIARSGGRSNQRRRSTQSTHRRGSSSAVPFGSSPAVTSTGLVLEGVSLTQSDPYYHATDRRVRPRVASVASSIASSYGDDTRFRAANVQNNNTPSFDIASRTAVINHIPYTFGWDNYWRPTAELGIATSSVHNQAYASFPSISSRVLPESRNQSLPPFL